LGTSDDQFVTTHINFIPQPFLTLSGTPRPLSWNQIPTDYYPTSNPLTISRPSWVVGVLPFDGHRSHI